MKKIILSLFACLSVLVGHTQDLTGKILFSHYNHVTQTDTIYSMENNGTNVTAITLGYRPRLSHDGKYLAFTNGPLPNQSYDGNIWMRDLTLEHDTLIVGNSDYLDYYDFYPDNSKLIYSEECGIFSTNIDGTNAYSAICYCGCYSDDPTVRLSDSMVVYHNVNEGIHTMEINGANVTTIPHTVPGDLYPLWSPDGQWIVYEKSLPGQGYITNNLCKIKPDGSDSTQLTTLATSDTITADPIWASDMQSVYVIARINTQLGLYRVNTDGSGTHTLVKSLYGGGSVFDYWLGLADSVSSNPVSVPAVPSSDFSFSLTPDPASSQTTIQLSLQKSLEVRLEVFDVMGRKVNTIYSGILSKGIHSLPLNVHALPAGNYFVRMVSRNSYAQKKLLVTN